MGGNNPFESFPGDGNVSPASFIQRQFWVLHSLAPNSPAYNVPLLSVIEGNLDVAALEQAIDALYRRNPIFRAVFSIDVSGRLVQKFSPWRAATLPLVDLRPSHVGEIAEKEIERAIIEEVRRPFDLSAGPLLRFKLFRRGQGSHLLAITAHHIIFDLVTCDMVAQELAEEYKAALLGIPRSEVPSRTDYATFSAWQEEWMQSDACKGVKEEWRRFLDGFEPALNLPAGRSTAEGLRRSGAVLPLGFAGERLGRLRAFCRQEGVTPFLVLLTAWALTLARWSGQKQLCIGVPLTNRRKEEFKRTMGCFVNILPLPVDISDSPTMRDVLRRVRMSMLRMHRMQELPYYHLAQLMRAKGAMSGNPLFQSGFTFEHPMRLQLEGLHVKPEYIHHGGSQLDLFAKFWEEPEAIVGVIEYDSARFDLPTVERIGRSFFELVEEILRSAQCKAENVTLMPAKDLDRIGNAKSVKDVTSTKFNNTIYPLSSEDQFLSAREELDSHIVAWNKTDRSYPLNKGLQCFIEEQVVKTPDAPAVTYEGATLSYKGLNKRVNQLAHFLRSKGVGPEVLVGVCTLRSLDMVIALLAIIKAGGAYVPFDPTYPVNRLAFMINDSKVPVILAQKACSTLINAETSQIIYFEDIYGQLESFPSTNPSNRTNPDNLAYVIYTSGSTGNPKGVMNTHKGIVNRLLWMQETFQIGFADTLVQKTPFSFDVSVWEFFWPFMFGARLVVAKSEEHKNADYLLDLIQREKITVIHFVPSMLRLFLERADQARCASLKHVVLSGEALSYSLQMDFFRKMGAVELHNLYGPTEAAVDVTYWRCRRDSDLRVVPIGRPIANTQIYILDERMQPLQIGVPGELHIGGVQVARGYLNQPELTAEKFLPDPFNDRPGARLYKTGDICRFLPDGSIEYLGRNDFQIKIRGQRIEIGEIEAVIEEHPDVRQSIVTAIENTPEDKRLIGYVVPNTDNNLSVSALRNFLKERLPQVMVPAAFVVLKEFPVTPSGKVDRKALPPPNSLRDEMDSAYVPPRMEIERIIVAVWQTVLHVEEVGINDNFFDLGGDSLLMAQVHGRLREKLSDDLTLLDMFMYPTISELARHLDRNGPVSDIAIQTAEVAVRRRSALNDQHLHSSFKRLKKFCRQA